MAVTYPVNHLLLRLNGHFGTIVTEFIDYWSVGFRIFLGSSPLTEANKTAFLTAVQLPCNQFHTTNGVAAPDNCWLDFLTAAYIGMDGHYVGGDTQPTTKYTYATPPKGAQGSGLPFSQARCFTLDTNLDRGRAAKGRFYYPNSTNVDASGRWSAAQCASAASAGVTLIDALNDAARAIWSPASAVSVLTTKGSGEIGTVTRVGVGRAPDTQRRRDNKLLEQHSYQDVPTTLEARQAVQDREYVLD